MSLAEAALSAQQALIGDEVGISNWITVDQQMIDQFADVTHDHQWIHLDADRAARDTPFGGTIAHGFLSLSLLSAFAYDALEDIEEASLGINYGMDKLRFLSPVRAGSKLRGRFTLIDAQLRKPLELQRRFALKIEIDGQESPALVAEWITLVIFPPN